MLPEATPELAQRSANAVRAALAQVRTPDGERITSGLGIATFPRDAVAADVLLHVADERLRLSKGGSQPLEPGVQLPATDRRFGQA